MGNNSTAFHKIENYILIGIFLLLIIGFCGEILEAQGIILIQIVNIRDFCMGLLQMQSGITALTIALIALVTGIIDTEYFGVGVANFFLILRPRVLGMFVLMGGSVVFLFTGAGLYIIGLYNLLISLFFCEFFLVLTTLIEIRELFLGKTHIRSLIRAYLLSQLSKEKNEEKNREIVRNLVQQWKSGIAYSEEDEYVELIIYALEAMLEENSDEAIRFVTNLWSELIAFLLSDLKDQNIRAGMRLLEETYGHAWSFILKHKEVGTGTEESFSLLMNVATEYLTAVSHFSSIGLLETVRFTKVIELAARVNMYFLRNHQEAFKVMFAVCEDLTQYMAYSLDDKISMNGSALDERVKSFFGRALRFPSLGAYNIPQECQIQYQMHRCRLVLGYILALIKNGHHDLLLRDYYNHQSTWNTNNPYDFLLKMAVQCYLFYLADIERTSLIGDKAKDSSKLLLGSDVVRKWNRDYLMHNANLLNHDLFCDHGFDNLLIEMLEKHEYFEIGKMRQVLTHHYVHIWYAFFLSYLSSNFMIQRRIRFYIRDYTSYIAELFSGNQEEKIAELFKHLVCWFPVECKDSEAPSTAASYLSILKRELTSVFITQEIQESKEIQKKFIRQNNGGAFEQTVSSKVKNRLETIFNPVLRESPIKRIYDTENGKREGEEKLESENGMEVQDNGTTVNQISFCVGKELNTTDFLNCPEVHSNYDIFGGALSDEICCYLSKHDVVDIYYLDHNKQQSDSAPIFEIMNSPADILIGNRYVLQPFGYENRKKFLDYIDNHTCIFTAHSRCAAGIYKNGLQITIDDVKVSVTEPDDHFIEKNAVKEDGHLKYEFENGLIGTFSKSELKEYYRNKYKVVEYTVVVTLFLTGKDIGIVILNE